MLGYGSIRNATTNTYLKIHPTVAEDVVADEIPCGQFGPEAV